MTTRKRSDAIKRSIEYGSQFYYRRIDGIDDKFIKSLCKNMICSTIITAYDFFVYLRGSGNIFYKNSRHIDCDTVHLLYKFNGVYDTVKFLSAGAGGSIVREGVRSGEDVEYILLEKKQLELALFNVFELSRSEQEMYYELFRLYNASAAEFELEFSKRAEAAGLFDGFNQTAKPLQSPAKLAFVTGFFYNSYTSFAKAVMYEHGIEFGEYGFGRVGAHEAYL